MILVKFKFLHIVVLFSILFLFSGCGTFDLKPEVSHEFKKNNIEVEDVCIKYASVLHYRTDGKRFVCDTKNITTDMIVWTKIDDPSFEQLFKNPEEALKWKIAGFTSFQVKNYIDQDLSVNEAIKWQKNGFTYDEVPLWIKYRFTMTEAKKWKSEKIRPKYANKWKQYGFNAKEAKKWHLSNISPANAKDWKKLGYSVIEAGECKHVYITPELAIQWKKQLGYSCLDAKEWSYVDIKPKFAKEWIKFSFGGLEAKRWSKNDFAPKEAKIWSKNNFDPQVAREWKEHKISIEEAKQWNNMKIDFKMANNFKKLGFNVKEIRRWSNENIELSEIQPWSQCGIKDPKKASQLIKKGYETAVKYCEYKNHLKRIRNTKPMKIGKGYICIGGLGGLAGKFSVSIGRYSIDINGGSIFAWEEATLYKSGSFKNYTLFKGFNSEGNKRSVRVLTKYGIKKQTDINFIYDHIAMHCILVK